MKFYRVLEIENGKKVIITSTTSKQSAETMQAFFTGSKNNKIVIETVTV